MLKREEKAFCGWLFRLQSDPLTALGREHNVALVVEIQSVVPLLALEEFVADFLHFESAILVLVEVNLVLVHLKLRISLMTFQSQLLVDVCHSIGELKALLVVGEADERLNLITLKVVASVLVEVQEESALRAVHFESMEKFFKIRREQVKTFDTTAKGKQEKCARVKLRAGDGIYRNEALPNER